MEIMFTALKGRYSPKYYRLFVVNGAFRHTVFFLVRITMFLGMRLCNRAEVQGQRRQQNFQQIFHTVQKWASVQKPYFVYWIVSFVSPHFSIFSPKYGLRISLVELNQEAPLLLNAMGQC